MAVGLGLLPWALAGLAATSADDPGVLHIGSRFELFVDDYLIEHMDGTELRLHHPVVRETVLRFDAPWEGEYSTYASVFADGDRYRMYYRGCYDPQGQPLAEPASLGWGYPEVTCVAESRGGIHWVRPKLRIFEWAGSRENNIVWMGDGSHCFFPFRDTNLDGKPEERYKAITP